MRSGTELSHFLRVFTSVLYDISAECIPKSSTSSNIYGLMMNVNLQ